MNEVVAPICIAVMAHNEERRIAYCLETLPLNRNDVAIHVVVNGSSDRTAEIAQTFTQHANNVKVHQFVEGGKSRSWNRFLFEMLPDIHPTHIFVDGDAQILAGSIDALAESLANNPYANAVSGVPRNGRNAEYYREEMHRTRGLFGDLYALRGHFLMEMKRRNIRLPNDLIGDDGLVGAMVKTDLESEASWDDERVVICDEAGFLCEPVNPFSLATVNLQRKRMINYSVRRFQNMVVSEIMKDTGPIGLPPRLALHYAEKIATMKPRTHPLLWPFDVAALRRMKIQMSNV